MIKGKQMKSALRRKNVLLLLIIVGFSIVLYVVLILSKVSPTDSSLLSQQPCKAPCWHGLTHGKSVAADVLKVAENDNFIPKGQYQKDVDPSKSRNILYWWFNSPQNANRIVIENGLLSSIEIVPNIPFSIQD